MSNTPKLADECKKLLDNKWGITLFKNDLGTYTAVASRPGQNIAEAMEVDSQITDDFEPSQTLYRLTEKVYGRIVTTTIGGHLWKIIPHGDGFAVMQHLLGRATGFMLDENGKWSVIGTVFPTEDEARGFAERYVK
jgi:hypothetical protein